jgi:pimeloyl-ACP methyl ester carboxylesterase
MSRDMLHVINTFRNQMTRPIIGVGHSMGAGILVHLATLHPRLLHSVILVDPIITTSIVAQKIPLVQLYTFRRDLWENREKVEEFVNKGQFYKTWDPRVRERMLKFGFRNTPTIIHPKASPSQVTLNTPKHQEAFTVARENYHSIGSKPYVSALERLTHPDVFPDDHCKAPFYRSEVKIARLLLPSLRPSCLYVFASESENSGPEAQADKLEATGSGYLGSGGMRLGRVNGVVVKGGHFLPMENPEGTATGTVDWIKAEVKRWQDDEAYLKGLRAGKTAKDIQSVDKNWLQESGVYTMNNAIERSRSRL